METGNRVERGQPGLEHRFGLDPMWLVALAAAAWMLCGFPGRPAFHGKYTESRRSEISREMLEETRDLLVPTLEGKPILTKPPVFYWCQVAAFRVTGRVDEAAARLPSILAALLCLGLTGAMARHALPQSATGDIARAAAPAASGMLASTWLFMNTARLAEIDGLFTALLTAEYYAVCRALKAKESASVRRWYALFWAAAGLAFAVKGPFSVIFPLAGTAVAAAVLRSRACSEHHIPLKPLVLNPGIALFAVFGLWWYAVLLYQRPDAWSVFRQETLGRLTEHTAHARGLFYYIKHAPSLAPWILCAPFVVRYVVRERQPVQWFLLTTTGVGMLVLFLLRSKKEVYMLPLVPAYAALCACWLVDNAAAFCSDRRARRAILIFLFGVGGAAAAAAVGMPIVAMRGFGAAHMGRWIAAAAIVGAAVLFSAVRAAKTVPETALPVFQHTLVLMFVAGAVLHQCLLPALDSTHSVKAFAFAATRHVPRDATICSFAYENYALSFYMRRIVPSVRKREWPLAESAWVIVPAGWIDHLRATGHCAVVLRNRDLIPRVRPESRYDLLLVHWLPKTPADGG